MVEIVFQFIKGNKWAIVPLREEKNKKVMRKKKKKKERAPSST
jgi:hypothetical protein